MQNGINALLSQFTAPKYLLRAETGKLVRVHQLNDKRKKPVNLSKCLTELGQKLCTTHFTTRLSAMLAR